MNKKNVFNDGKRQNFPYSTSEFKRIRPYERYEVDPILSQLFVKNMAEHPELADQLSETKRYNRYVNEILTMYIIIRNVSALEYYLRHAASKIVDSNKSIEFDFVNPLEINWVFSRLLGKKFFETIKKINSRAGKHPWKCCRSRGLVKNWHNFENMFEQRNEIVHLMKRIRLSKDELCSL